MQHNQNSIDAAKRGVRTLASNHFRREADRLKQRLKAIDEQIDALNTRAANAALRGDTPNRSEQFLIRELENEKRKIDADQVDAERKAKRCRQ
jgi:hypothetical protein